MFYLEYCPYCKRARNYMKELQEEDPRYMEIPIRMIEESQQKDLAGSYDYYYVPTYFVGDEKVSEGGVDKEGVRAVFDKALAQ